MSRRGQRTSRNNAVEKDFKIQLTIKTAKGEEVVVGWVNLSDSFAKKVAGISAKDLQFAYLDATKIQNIISNCEVECAELVDATAEGYDDFEAKVEE